MATVYKVDLQQFKVMPVECDVIGWPNTDINGDIMYANSHFEDESDAWDQIKADAEAWREQAARHVTEIEYKLEQSKRECLASVENYDRVYQEYSQWQANKSLNPTQKGAAKI